MTKLYREGDYMRHPSLQTLLVLLSLTSLAQSSYAQIAAEPSPFTSDNPNAVVPGLSLIHI